MGAMSFVNCDIPDNCVAVGVPAKVIKKIEFAPQRHSPDQSGIPRGKDYTPEK